MDEILSIGSIIFKKEFKFVEHCNIVDIIHNHERDLQWIFFGVKIYFFFMLSGRMFVYSILKGEDLYSNVLSS